MHRRDGSERPPGSNTVARSGSLPAQWMLDGISGPSVGWAAHRGLGGGNMARSKESENGRNETRPA
jgi:hypothetical protein